MGEGLHDSAAGLQCPLPCGHVASSRCAASRGRASRWRSRSPRPTISLLKNGRIVDGTGTPWFTGDVAIRGDAIATIAPSIDGAGGARDRRRTATSIAPGFIDIHTHARRGITQAPTAPNYARQGVTTVMEGPDGSSPLPLAPFLAQIEALEIVDQHRQLRRPGLGAERRDRRRQPQGDGRRNPEDDRARRAGHEGRRVRHEHRPLLRPWHLHADRGSHRAGARRPAASAASTSRISATTRRSCSTASTRRSRSARQGHLPTQISHAKVVGVANWGRSADMLALVDAARARGVDVTIDQYPYTASSTSVAAALIPAWVLEGGREATLARLKDSGSAREGQGRHRHDDPRRARRRRSEERAVRQLRLRPVAGRQDARRPDARARQAADDQERGGGGDVDRRAGRLPGHLPRDERARPGPHPAPSGDDDRVGRRGAGLRPRQPASAQLRDVRAGARASTCGRRRR